MQSFINWLESSLRDNLQAPQNPHHPEGNVARHTYMVLHALNSALKLLQDKQQEDPTGPFSNLDLILTPEDMNMLRLAALLHDIGKSIVTNPTNLSAHGHEDPKNFEQAMQLLGPTWQKIYQNAAPQDKDDLWFLIKNHMKIGEGQMIEDKALKKEMMTQDGKYKNDRRYKLLLILFLMDRMGRGSEPNLTAKQARDFSSQNIDPAKKRIGIMNQSSQWIKNQTTKQAKQPTIDTPEEFVSTLKKKGLSKDFIIKNMKNKWPDLDPSIYLDDNMK